MKVILHNALTIPAGSYSIGLNHQEINQILSSQKEAKIKKEFMFNSCPRHTVTLQPYMMYKKLVTLNEFRRFIDATGYCTDAEKEGWGWTWHKGWKKVSSLTWEKPFGSLLDEHYTRYGEVVPVLQVSWNDAKSYCSWISGVSGVRCDLPDESQWETAAEIISKAADKKSVKSFYEAEIKNVEDYLAILIEVMESHRDVVPPGIIWEWTDNWFDMYPGGDYNKEFGLVYKVLRGGSLMSDSVQRIKQYRFRRCPTARSPFYSFRFMMPLQ